MTSAPPIAYLWVGCHSRSHVLLAVSWARGAAGSGRSHVIASRARTMYHTLPPSCTAIEPLSKGYRRRRGRHLRARLVWRSRTAACPRDRSSSDRARNGRPGDPVAWPVVHPYHHIDRAMHASGHAADPPINRLAAAATTTGISR